MEHIELLKETMNRLPGPGGGLQWHGDHLKLPSGKNVQLVTMEKQLTTPVVENTILRRGEGPLLLFAPYVSPPFADRLRKNDVFFVDETGNAFLESPKGYLFISRTVPGNQRPGVGKRAAGKDFSPNTLKLIYAFLTDTAEDAESCVNQTVRKLKARTGVSTGSISGGMDSLKSQGFLEEREPGLRMLARREQLLQRWVEGYARKLRPKLVSEHYCLPQPGWAEELLKVEAPGLWGGEVAGARLTGYLVPETVTLYSVGLPSEFIVKHDLRKDPTGRVEVLRPFWPGSHPPSFKGCVHPLIVYADLMATEIDRNLETAKRIYEQYLRPLATSN